MKKVTKKIILSEILVLTFIYLMMCLTSNLNPIEMIVNTLEKLI